MVPVNKRLLTGTVPVTKKLLIFFSDQNFVLKKKFIFVDQKILDHACFGQIFFIIFFLFNKSDDCPDLCKPTIS